MAGMELFQGASEAPDNRLGVGDAAIIIREDMTFEILMPAASESDEDITRAHIAAVGLGRVMSRQDAVDRMVENIKRSIGLSTP
jgi:RNA-splicing ligase RtcB